MVLVDVKLGGDTWRAKLPAGLKAACRSIRTIFDLLEPDTKGIRGLGRSMVAFLCSILGFGHGRWFQQGEFKEFWTDSNIGDSYYDTTIAVEFLPIVAIDVSSSEYIVSAIPHNLPDLTIVLCNLS
jgi:hypothetical protein